MSWRFVTVRDLCRSFLRIGLWDSSIAFGVPSSICQSVSAVPIFVPLEQFHDRSHVQLTQALANGFAKDISDRSDDGRVLLPSRGMNL